MMDKTIDKYPYKKGLYFSWYEAGIANLILFKCTLQHTQIWDKNLPTISTSSSHNKESCSRQPQPRTYETPKIKSIGFSMRKSIKWISAPLQIFMNTLWPISKSKLRSSKIRGTAPTLIWCILISWKTAVWLWKNLDIQDPMKIGR